MFGGKGEHTRMCYDSHRAFSAWLRRTLFVTFGVSVFAPIAAAQDIPPSTIIWTGGKGDWSNPSNWLFNHSFDSLVANVLIDGGNPETSVVALDVDACTENLVVDSDDVLILLDGHSLMFNGANAPDQINCAGVIQINGGEGGPASLIVNYPGELFLQGGGHLVLTNSAYSKVLSSTPSGLLHNLDCTIEGTGVLGAGILSFDNTGLVDANAPFQELTLHPAALGVMNIGTLQASNGGSLRLLNATIANFTGQIRALDNSHIYLDGVTIIGGTLSTSGNGIIQTVTAPTIWQDVTNSGDFEMGAVKLTILGEITNDGEMHLVAGDSLVPPPLFSEVIVPPGSGDVKLSGSGVMDMRLAKIYSGSAAPGGQLINGPNHTIKGKGLIGANTVALTNHGIIAATDNMPLVIDPRGTDLVVNDGTLRAESPAGLVLSGGSFRNDGVVEVLNGSRCMYTASATELNAADGILMGTWRVIGDRAVSQLLIPGPGIFFNAGDVTLSGSGSMFGLIDSMIENSGHFAILNGKQFTSSAISFSNFGVLEIGSESRFNAVEFVQDSLGELDLEVSATNFQSGSAGLVASGLATMHGTLHITVADNYSPSVGQTLHIVKAGSLSGAFENVVAPAGFNVSSNATEVIVTVTSTCAGDIDGSGVVNFGDLNAVISQWGACPAPPGNCSADLNDDNIVNASDLLVLLSAWGPCVY